MGSDPGDGFPHEVMSWDRYQRAALRVGGQGGLGFLPTRVVQIDAEDKISLMLGGGSVIKIQDHPDVGPLMHLSEVRHFWFGSTIDGDADFSFQGTNTRGRLDSDGTARGYRMTIRGQGMSDLGDADAVHGGDVEICGGDAQSGYGAERRPGNVVLRGGAAGHDTTGNVALHSDPGDSWGDGQRILFVGNAQREPSHNPEAGGFLFARDGALFWRGSRGTVTQIAPP